MRKLLIVFIAAGLFIACNNDKGKVPKDDKSTTTKDDYKDNDNTRTNNERTNTDRENTNTNDTRNTEPEDNNSNSNMAGGWSSSERTAFVSSCVSSAVNEGIPRATAQSYCSCMQEKLEQMYPNTSDAAHIDMESPSMKRMAANCLTQQ